MGQAVDHAVGQAVGQPEPEGDAMVDVADLGVHVDEATPLLEPTEAGVLEVVEAVLNGLAEEPPLACVKSNEKLSFESC